jgi:hypothetical protein
MVGVTRRRRTLADWLRRRAEGAGACAPTFEVAGAVSAGQAFPHEADGWIEWTQTAAPSADATRVRFRQQDENNRWDVQVVGGGDLYLFEWVAGGPTARGFVGAGVTNGDVLVVELTGTTIRVYVDGSQAIEYASATNFATRTTGEVSTLGTGGAVSDLRTWSYACSPLP